MTRLKRQKLIWSTQILGYNTHFLLYPRPLSVWNICSFCTYFTLFLLDTLFKKAEIYLHTKFRYLKSMAEIKLLPVLDDGRPPCWNFTSSFDFDLLSMCNYPHVSLLQPAKFLVIGRTSANFWNHIDFSRWRT